MLQLSDKGVRLAFIDAWPPGSRKGEPILLIHGFASTHAVNWVFPKWVQSLTEAGRRVVALDLRGHGRSDKFYDPSAYAMDEMLGDILALLNRLEIEAADVMGYSMGGRIGAFFALNHPQRVRSLIVGGLGSHLVDHDGLPDKIIEAMEAPSLASLADPAQHMFRAFAESTKSDLKALAAFARGARWRLSELEAASLRPPILVAVGTNDTVAGDAHKLAALFPMARALDIPGRDHNRAVGDKVYKTGVLDFLSGRP
ncbi:MAG TPA: alpha/beta hydrolase [Methylocella sp.]|nr:alpha/beta hydrolase [Methylocella sp.]